MYQGHHIRYIILFNGVSYQDPHYDTWVKCILHVPNLTKRATQVHQLTT